MLCEKQESKWKVEKYAKQGQGGIDMQKNKKEKNSREKTVKKKMRKLEMKEN